MKDRKQLSTDELIEQTIKQLASRFTPTKEEVKARIDNLIEREFIEKNQDNLKYVS